MGVAAKLAGFAAILLVTFGAAFGIGRSAGPVGGDPAAVPVTSPSTTTTMPMEQGGHS